VNSISVRFNKLGMLKCLIQWYSYAFHYVAYQLVMQAAVLATSKVVIAQFGV